MSTGVHLALLRTENLTRYGYTRVSLARCPRHLIGSPHLGRACWCNSRLNLNAGTYQRHGQHLVMWEPTGFTPADLAAVHTPAEGDGLRLTVHGASPYRPGHSLAIEFTPGDR